MSQELATPAKEKDKDIRPLIASDMFKRQLALALPKHMTPDRFARVALTALTRNPKLLDCTRESLLRCLMDCSALGIEPNGRDAHLIPYKTECTLIIDYKGLIALARRSGEVALIWAELVKEGDSFDWKNGVVTHGIDWRRDRGQSQAVYSYVKFKDGSEDWNVMTLAEVESVRKRSRSKDAGPWVSDYDEMAKKTAIRRHSKRLTLSPEFADALDKDDDRDERSASGREVVDDAARGGMASMLANKPAPLIAPSAADEVALKLKDSGFSEGDLLFALGRLRLTSAASLGEVSVLEFAEASARWKDIEESMFLARKEEEAAA